MQNMAEYAVVGYKKGEGNLVFNCLGKQHYIQGDFLRGMNVIENYIKPDKLKHNNKILRIEEKSSDLYMEIFSRFANIGNTIFDFFAGSASAAYAAMKLGMKWYGCEINKTVYDYAMNKLRFQHALAYRTSNLPTLNAMRMGVKVTEEHKKVQYNLPTNIAEAFSRGESITNVLILDCESNSVVVKESRLVGCENEEGLFADKIFNAGEIICTYWEKC